MTTTNTTNAFILLISILAFISCNDTSISCKTEQFLEVDSSKDDSTNYMLTPLVSIINGDNEPQKIYDTLLSCDKVKNILACATDTLTDINLFVFGGKSRIDESTQKQKIKYSKEDFIICLWSINKKTFMHKKIANFHFDLNTLDFYVIDMRQDSENRKVTFDKWCEN